MSTRELERVEVMGRVSKKELKLTDATAMLQLSYRQESICGDATGRWALQGRSTAMQVKPPIEANHGSFGGDCCGASGRSTPVRPRSDLDQRWPPNTWREKMAWSSITRPYDAGC